jgi:hypothetical protein
VRQSPTGKDVRTEAEDIGEDTADLEGSVCAVVKCISISISICSIVNCSTICKRSVNLITNLNPICRYYMHVRKLRGKILPPSGSVF